MTNVKLAVITEFPIPSAGLPEVEGEYALLGCTTEERVKLPSQPNKPIPCKLNPARWMVPGRAVLGQLAIDSLDFADVETDLLFFNKKRCVALLETLDQEGNVVRQMYCIDWSPEIDLTFPEGDTESKVSAAGPFARELVYINGNLVSGEEAAP